MINNLAERAFLRRGISHLIFSARNSRVFFLLSALVLSQQSAALAALAEESPETVVQKSPADTVNLKGIISLYDGPTPEQLVGKLVSAALLRDQAHEEMLKKDRQMKSPVQAVIDKAKVSVHYMVEYRGFEMSSEAADIILDEKLRLKSSSSTEYASQRRADEVHARIFASLLQLAQGLGTADPVVREKTIATGMAPLNDLVGSEAAGTALSSLKSWSAQTSVPDSILKQQPWTMMELQQKTDDLVKEAARSDPVMGLVRRTLHKYNRHSRLSLGAAKVINTGLSLAMLSPTFAAPAASILQYVYQMSTGGPEDYKLLTELYLDRRLDSRWKRLNQEATLSVHAYNDALMTGNPVLLGLSESFISALGGEETGVRIIGANKLVARQSTHNDAIDCLQTHGAM
jgi:hypothetical protein